MNSGEEGSKKVGRRGCIFERLQNKFHGVFEFRTHRTPIYGSRLLLFAGRQIAPSDIMVAHSPSISTQYS